VSAIGINIINSYVVTYYLTPSFLYLSCTYRFAQNSCQNLWPWTRNACGIWGL